MPTQLTNPADANYLKNLTATVNYITSNGAYAILDPYVVLFTCSCHAPWSVQRTVIDRSALTTPLRFYMLFTPQSSLWLFSRKSSKD